MSKERQHFTCHKFSKKKSNYLKKKGRLRAVPKTKMQPQT